MADLRDLGLSEYEARAYRALLDTGPTTAKELSETSGVPMGRIYDVLNSIEAYDLVRTQTASNPKKYIAVEPSSGLERLLKARKAELEAEAERYEGLVDDLKRELDAGPIRGDGFWTAALGPQETIDLLVERIDAANERVVSIIAPPTGTFDMSAIGDRMLDHVEEAAGRDVEVALLIAHELVAQVPEELTRRYAEELADRENLSVRVGDTVDGNITVIDGVEVCVDVPHPLDGEGTFAMINLKSPAFANDILGEFTPRWETAEPFSA